MKKGMSFSRCITSLAFVAACAVAFSASRGFAQPPANSATPAATLVAVVDLAKVFEAHPSFKANMEAVREELKKVDKQLQAKQTTLNARNKQLNNLNPTSSDYRRLEAELARQIADLQVQARQAKKSFTRQEARYYYDAYSEIVRAVRAVADKYNIGLVLRFDSSEIDPDTPQSIAQSMGRTVVVQRNLDITHLVVSQLQTTLAQRNSQDRAPRR